MSYIVLAVLSVSLIRLAICVRLLQTYLLGRVSRQPALIQSGSACVQVALAKVKLDAPSTATKICAMRISCR